MLNCRSAVTSLLADPPLSLQGRGDPWRCPGAGHYALLRRILALCYFI